MERQGLKKCGHLAHAGIWTQGRHHARGVTLIETLITVFLLCLLAFIALPTWQTHLLQKRLESAAETYRQHFQWARSHAMRSGQTVSIRFASDASGSCYIVFTGPETACGCNAASAQCTAPARLLVSEHLPAERHIAMQPKSGNPTFRLGPLHGTVTPNPVIVFSAPNGQSLHEVANRLGRTRSCSPQGGLPGWPACTT